MVLASMIPRVIAALLLVLAPAPNVAAQSGPSSCTTAGQNLYVRDVMSDLYFWYREIPSLDPVKFDSPEAYLDAIRYKTIDKTFSYITSRASNDAFFSDSQFIGFGFSTLIVADQLRITDVFPDSPASEANLARGDRIVEINGQSVAALFDAGGLGDVFGSSDVGVQGQLLVQRGGVTYQAHMTKRLVTIPTVSLTKVYETEGGRRVGYVSFKNFVQPSFDALDVAFADLRARQVNELVLDLRYNGGGLVSVAQHLASLIGGTRTTGQVFAQYFHNDRNRFRDSTLRFQDLSNALALDRLIVITTRASASASELVINALRPFMPVFVVGDRTYGKPVGQYGITFCDKVLAPVSFTVRNANGEGDYFDGLAPTCAAPDDLDHPLGDAAEGSLHEAVVLILTGQCSHPASTGLAPSRRRLTAPGFDGWQDLVGAH